MAAQERGEALLAQTARVCRAWVALQERQRGRAVDLGEHLGRAGPEALQLRAQLISEPLARSDQILAPASQRPQRLRAIAGRFQDPEAVTSAGEFGEHERIEAVALAARRTEPRPGRAHLVRVHRDHRQPGIQQPLHQQPIRPLDRDQRDAEPQQPGAQRPDPALVMPVAAALHDPPMLVDNAHGVFLASPINASDLPFLHDHPPSTNQLTVVGGEVPWRMLTDGALTTQLPGATRGTSTECREALVSNGPSARASAKGALPASADKPKDAPVSAKQGSCTRLRAAPLDQESWVSR